MKNFLTEVNNSDDSLPPKMYLKLAAKHCPESVSVYMDLWDKKNGDNIVSIAKEEVYSSFIISYTKFMNRARELSDEGLVTFLPVKDKIVIEVTDWLDEESAFV
jgi:hypothetical protein